MRPNATLETAAPTRTVEAVILWGETSVLHAAHLVPPQELCVGEDAPFAMSEAWLGMERWPVVRCDAGEHWAVVPRDASCAGMLQGEAFELDALAQRGLVRPSGELAGAREVRITEGMALRIEHRGFSFVVRDLPAEKIAMPGVLASMDREAQRWTLGSIAVQAVLFFGLYFLVPPSIVRSVDVVNTQSRLVKYAIEENTLPPPPPEPSPSDGGKPGKAHEGDMGQVGRKNPKKPCNDCGTRAKPNPNPTPTREEAKAMAMQAGIIGVLQALRGDVDAAESRFAANTALDGQDAENMLALFGPNVGEARGLFGGLGPIGSGRGGGGDGKGTQGLGRIGTIGGSTGDGTYGVGAAGPLAGRTVRVPKIHPKDPEIMGSLSKEVIRRTIGRHIAEVRHCYTQALISRPELQGRVVIQFVISPSGAVQKAIVKESTLSDANTAQCVANVVNRIDFPAPQGGLVIVSYPFVLSQT